MKRRKATLVLCIVAMLIHSIVLADKIIVTDKISDQKYNYLKITVESDYVNAKQFATENEPAQPTKTYRWQSEIVSNSCSTNCGTGASFVSTKCVERLGVTSKIVDNLLCIQKIGEYTESTPSCTDWSGCGAQYSYSTWGACKPEEKKYRTATCVDVNDQLIPDEACDQVIKEELDTACVYMPATCNDIRANNPSSPSGFYLLYPDGITFYNIYCDMAIEGGGWMQIMVANGASSGAKTASPTGEKPGYLDPVIMKKFAALSSQVLVKDHTGQYVVSKPEARPIQALRTNDRLMVLGENHQDWTSPTGLATKARFSKTCLGGNDFYPHWILWACGNTSGVHLEATRFQWTHTGGGYYTGIVYLR